MLFHYFKTIIFLFAGFFLLSCSSAVRFSSCKTEGIEQKYNNQEFYEEGFASYYSDYFIGKTTASGEIYSQKDFTAAHRTLPFGSRVRVRNLSNGKEVVVRINDRGPFVESRIIDLSRSAAEKIDLIRQGVAKVQIKLIN